MCSAVQPSAHTSLAALYEPWMLSGGLTVANVAEAISISGAASIDVSSGVEDRPGHKDPDLIRDFLRAANH